LFFASAAEAEAAAAAGSSCRVTINDQDVTDEFFVVDDTQTEKKTYYVDCMDKSKCRDALIVDCPVVKCFDAEACNSAQIVNFTESVLCEGVHSCHRTNITAAAGSGHTVVSCVGSQSCDVTQFDRVDEISFSGAKAGRKVRVEHSKLVECRDGHDEDVYVACTQLATIETECLYCGKNGCSPHINECRYKLLDGDEDDDEEDWLKYHECQPDTVLGTNCPDGMEKKLQLELSGMEEIEVAGALRNQDDESKTEKNDGGGKRKKRGVMRGL